jgi:hypothetical protein
MLSLLTQGMKRYPKNKVSSSRPQGVSLNSIYYIDYIDIVQSFCQRTSEASAEGNKNTGHE